jgi:hypothetical protein
MVTGAQLAAARLEARLGPDRVRFQLGWDEDHASIVPSAMAAFLRFASKA